MSHKENEAMTRICRKGKIPPCAQPPALTCYFRCWPPWDLHAGDIDLQYERSERQVVGIYTKAFLHGDPWGHVARFIGVGTRPR